MSLPFEPFKGKEFELVFVDKGDSYNIGPITYIGKQNIFLLFIGREDIYQQEIYEGDVVEVDDTQIGGHKYIGEVYYCTDYTLESNPGFAVWVPRKGHAELSCSVRVLGNKYENPELLE